MQVLQCILHLTIIQPKDIVMSHSGNPTVNNTNIYLESVNNGLSTLGGTLANIPAGTPVPVITQGALRQMRTALTAQWTTVFGTTIPLPPSNQDSGYFGPWKDVLAGQPVPCVIQQIQGDFSNWGLPLADNTVPTTITKQITQEISSQGGQAGFSSGTFQLTSSESIYWLVGYMTVAISQEENGILYAFAANAAINF